MHAGRRLPFAGTVAGQGHLATLNVRCDVATRRTDIEGFRGPGHQEGTEAQDGNGA